MIEELETLVAEAEAKGKIGPDERIELMDALLAFEPPEMTDENVEEVESTTQALDGLMQRASDIPDDESALPAGEPDPRFPADPNTPKRGFLLAQAEQNGTLATGKLNMSFGNGNEQGDAKGGGWGFVAPYDLEITQVTLGSRTETDGNGAGFEIVVNRDPNGNSVDMEGTEQFATIPGKSRTSVSDVSVKVERGQSVNLLTSNPGGQDIVASIWGCWI